MQGIFVTANQCIVSCAGRLKYLHCNPQAMIRETGAWVYNWATLSLANTSTDRDGPLGCSSDAGLTNFLCKRKNMMMTMTNQFIKTYGQKNQELGTTTTNHNYIAVDVKRIASVV
jgi:hypothetical protein